MSGFSEQWLSFREGVDSTARNGALTGALVARLSTREGLHVVDLGAGTGANVRYLAPRLGSAQNWWLIDDDVSLLARIPPVLFDWAQRRAYRATDEAGGVLIEGPSFTALVRWIRADLATSFTDLPLVEVDLVTASALLDLTSSAWIDSLSLACHQNGCTALFSLTYDGRIKWTPEMAQDTDVRDLLNCHQRRDKGFGPALGPEAARYTSERFTALGYEIQSGHSDWRLGTAQTTLQQTLVASWARAVLEQEPMARAWIETWVGARTADIQRGSSRLSVGHVDMLALPMQDRSTYV